MLTQTGPSDVPAAAQARPAARLAISSSGTMRHPRSNIELLAAKLLAQT